MNLLKLCDLYNWAFVYFIFDFEKENTLYMFILKIKWINIKISTLCTYCAYLARILGTGEKAMSWQRCPLLSVYIEPTVCSLCHKNYTWLADKSDSKSHLVFFWNNVSSYVRDIVNFFQFFYQKSGKNPVILFFKFYYWLLVSWPF